MSCYYYEKFCFKEKYRKIVANNEEINFLTDLLQKSVIFPTVFENKFGVSIIVMVYNPLVLCGATHNTWKVRFI